MFLAEFAAAFSDLSPVKNASESGTPTGPALLLSAVRVLELAPEQAVELLAPALAF